MAKISVVLDKATHRKAKDKAQSANPTLTLMQYVANLVKEDLAKTRKNRVA